LPEQGWVIEMVVYDVSANVVFFGGAAFDPPAPAWNRWAEPLREAEDLEEAKGP
jgi:hypothetical protein